MWGQRRLNYLKHHRKVLYYNLLTSSKLHSHLADTEEQAQQLFLRLVNELAEKEGVTEQLKAADMLLWVQKMNNIRDKATKIVNIELIYAFEIKNTMFNQCWTSFYHSILCKLPQQAHISWQVQWCAD